MLVEILSRQNIKGSTLEEAQKASGPALDALWRTHWIKDSVMKKDVALLAPLKDFADEIAESSDCVVITAGRQEALAIRAALAAVPAEEGRPEVIVCEPTFSPSWYGDLFEKLEGRRCVQLAVTAGAEDLLLRCAYATVKRFIFENGRNVPGNVLESEEHSRVYAVCGRGSTVIAQDAQENDYPAISLDDTVDPMYLANTAAVLLPVLIRGGDGAAFLEGFGEVVAAPDWDISATAYAYIRAGFERSCTAGVPTFFAESWQQEYGAMAEWAAGFSGGMLRRPLSMPTEKMLRDSCYAKARLEILIGAEESAEDLMTPPFEGCDPDGSLQLLLKAEKEHDFYDELLGGEGFEFKVEQADAAGAGALMAFLQMSEGIAAWLAAHGE
ncbi:MAG: hypothetical protein IIY84_04460 [Eubacterium sp.]|nr:hypothetical protein [Eubacterium sp.]